MRRILASRPRGEAVLRGPSGCSVSGVRRVIVTTLAGIALASALAIGAAAADHDPLDDGCPPLDASFCVQEEEGPDGIPVSTAITLIALFWVTPLVLAAVFASRHNENVGTAISLTFFLGWIGLLVVYRGQRRSAAALMQAAEPGRGRT